MVSNGLTDYDVNAPNCNTWTNYIDLTYIKGSQSVFDKLGGGWYPGKDKIFINSTSGDDLRDCKIIEDISRKFLSCIVPILILVICQLHLRMSNIIPTQWIRLDL